jgi:glycosyltransferase involved in cell wall biosynthesis
MTRRIRVLHVGRAAQGYGAERVVVELLRRLATTDIDVGLLTLFEAPVEARAALPFPLLHAGRKRPGDPFFLPRLIREMRHFAPDVVHTHTLAGKYWGRVAAVAARISCIVHTEHNPCDFRNRPALSRAADRLLNRASSKVITFFAEQSEALRAFEHLPASKLVVIPNGLVTSEREPGDAQAVRQRLGIAADQFVVLLVGRMEFQKNHILALRAFASLSQATRSRMLMLFAGAGENEEMLRGMTHALDLAEHVRFLGYRNDVPEILAASDLLLMTSWFEGMPLALLEAMLAGVPIVSTPWIGARNMLGDGQFGFLTAGYEPAQVAAEIERAASHPALRRETAERARRRVQQEYDIDRMADAYRDLYVHLRGAAS